MFSRRCWHVHCRHGRFAWNFLSSCVLNYWPWRLITCSLSPSGYFENCKFQEMFLTCFEIPLVLQLAPSSGGPGFQANGAKSTLTKCWSSVFPCAKASPACPATEAPPWAWGSGTAACKGTRWRSTLCSKGTGEERDSESDGEKSDSRHSSTEWAWFACAVQSFLSLRRFSDFSCCPDHSWSLAGPLTREKRRD